MRSDVTLIGGAKIRNPHLPTRLSAELPVQGGAPACLNVRFLGSVNFCIKDYHVQVVRTVQYLKNSNLDIQAHNRAGRPTGEVEKLVGETFTQQILVVVSSQSIRVNQQMLAKSCVEGTNILIQGPVFVPCR